MLKIQVLGSGLIPRGYGLAPRIEPFPADLTLIQTIMATPGLSVNMIHPDDGHIVAVTNANVKRLWEKYSGKVCKEPVAPATPKPSATVSKPAPVVTPPKQEKEETPIKETSTPEVKVEKPAEEKPVVEKPVENVKTNNNQHNNNNNQKQNNNNTFKPINSDEKKN